jgi:tetratricopeptide (TPR) repeat protein
LFYIGVIGLGLLALQVVLGFVFTFNDTTTFNFGDTIIGKAATGSPLIFWPIVAASLVIAGVGWWFDAHSGDDEASGRQLPLARDLRAVNFKLGDDVAAETQYIVAPVQEVYLRAINALRDAAARAPSAKNGVIIMGVANAGKTRLAFEVVKKSLPNWRVLIWRPDDREPAIAALRDQNVVIFIDDLQEHAPSEIRYARGAAQALDNRALALRKMEELVRSHARQVVIVATCRSEDVVRTQARIGWLFTELETVEMPVFPLKGPEVEHIIEEFQRQALQRMQDWDGTLGSLVLGLSAKRQAYAELAVDRDPARQVLQAMKLLTAAGVVTYTEQRLRAICVKVFFRSDLDHDETWQETLNKLIRMQFVAEDSATGNLVIRKDSYFDQVITDYPPPERAMQLERDLEKTLQALIPLRDVEAVFQLGNAFYRLKQYAEALQAYDYALTRRSGATIDITPTILWRNKGAVLQSQRHYAEALEAYDRAIAFDGAFASAWRNRGGALDEMEHYSEELVAYDRALTIQPDYAAALNGKGKTLYKLHRLDEAVAAYTQATEFDPVYDFAWRNLGDALQNLKRYTQALAAYDKAIEINEAYAYAWNGKGVVLHELGRAQEALAAFDRALKLDPKLYYAHNGRGAALRDLERVDEALLALDTSLELKPDYASAWKNKGTVLGLLKRHDEALAAFDRALALDASYCSAWSGRGVTLLALGQDAEAVTAFDRALAIDTNYAQALSGKATALRKLGRDAEARAVEVQAQRGGAQTERDETTDAPEEQRDQESMPSLAKK